MTFAVSLRLRALRKGVSAQSTYDIVSNAGVSGTLQNDNIPLYVASCHKFLILQLIAKLAKMSPEMGVNICYQAMFFGIISQAL